MLQQAQLPPAFPDAPTLARAFWEEAARHLTDAYSLHGAGRYAAAITSSMKAAELSVKSALILNNAIGLYEKVFGTHKPLTQIETHPILKQLDASLENLRPDVRIGVKEMESLEPTPFGKGNFDPNAGETNTEYPFLLKTLEGGSIVARLHSPQNYFPVAESARYFIFARDLMETLPILYPAIAAWQTLLPSPL